MKQSPVSRRARVRAKAAVREEEAVLKANLSDMWFAGSTNADIAELISTHIPGQLSARKAAKFTGSIFRNSDLQKVDFHGIDMTNSDFSGALIAKSTILEHTILDNSDLRYLDLSSRNMRKARMEDVNIRKANVRSAKLPSSTLKQISANSLIPDAGRNDYNDVTIIDLHKQSISILPQQLPSFHILTSLDLSNNNFVSVPGPLFQLTCLEVLKLQNNRIKSLPNLFHHINKLSYLDISENAISSPLPVSLLRLRHLGFLDMSKNEVRSLDDPLSKEQWSLPSLHVLNANNNLLETFNYSEKHLPSITNLFLSENILKRPPETGKFPLVNELTLASNKITSVSEAFVTSFPNLEILTLKSNKIQRLSYNIGLWTKMKHFSLANNQISGLPSSFAFLTCLETLNLSENMLFSISGVIPLSEMLVNIDLSKNQLKNIPDSLFEIESLQHFVITGNPCTQDYKKRNLASDMTVVT